MKNTKDNASCFSFIFIIIIALGIIMLGVECIEKISDNIHQKKMEAYFNSPEYKKMEAKSEEEKQKDIETRYKNTEPFVGMPSKYAKNTAWGKPDATYSAIVRGGAKADVYEEAYIWFSKKYAYPNDDTIEILGDNYYKQNYGPMIERRIVTEIGLEQVGKSVNDTAYINQVTIVEDNRKELDEMFLIQLSNGVDIRLKK